MGRGVRMISSYADIVCYRSIDCEFAIAAGAGFSEYATPIRLSRWPCDVPAPELNCPLWIDRRRDTFR